MNMNEQEIISTISLSRGSLSKTCIAYYDAKGNTVYYYLFRDDYSNQILLSLLQKEKITLTVIQKELKNLAKLLLKVTKIVTVDRKEFISYHSVQSEDYYSNCTINCLLNYLDLDYTTMRNIKINRKYSTKFMFIPEKVVNELNLIGSKGPSFLNLVDHTRTKYGANKLQLYILQPLIEEDLIRERHDSILYFIKNELFSTKLENILKEIPYVLNTLLDSSTSKDTIEGLKRYAVDCRKMNIFLKQCEILNQYLTDDLNIFKVFHGSYKESKIKDVQLKFSLVFDNLEIKTGLDDYLDLARKIKEELHSDIIKMADSCPMKEDLKIIETPKGICFKISNQILLDHPEIVEDINFESNLSNEAYSVMSEFMDSSINLVSKRSKVLEDKRSKASSLVLLAKNKTYSLVVTPQIYKLNLLLCSIQNQIDEIEGEISFNLLNSIKEDLETLIPLCERIAEIDVSFSAYKFSLKHDCSIPQFGDKICISNSYYPPLKASIFNDYYSDQDSLLSVITGPNMSGKSTYLKQLSYLIILSQIGYPLTARFALMKIFKSLYIGFNSTRIDFKEINSLLGYHTASTLIMIDEPGKGYDSNVLYSFYTVLFKRIMKSNSTVFFITHHHKIIQFLNNPNLLSVNNFKVRFGISRIKKGMQICEENLPKIYLDWLNKKEL